MSFKNVFGQTGRISSALSAIKRLSLYGMYSLGICLTFTGVTLALEGTDAATKNQTSLAGERVITGTVEEIRGEQAKVNTGEVQPRFLPMNLRKDKGLPDLKKGDRVEITLNDQNLIVDVHLPGEASRHQKVRGKLAQPLITGHEKAVIQTTEGKEESHLISSMARSKVGSIPVGVEAMFLIDEMGQIVDVTLSSQEEVKKAQHLPEKKSPLKGNFKKVTGTIKKPLQDNRISIKKEGKGEQEYEVRPLIQEKLQNLSAGHSVILFLDDENKVTDASFSPDKK